MGETAAWVRRIRDGSLFYCLAGFDLNMGEEKFASMPAEIK